jgi:hypothetical protein
MISLPLNSVNSEWEKQYSLILADPFIKRKYNRERRIKDKIAYIEEWTPEVMQGNGFVVDIGSGPGEYLELCRFFGNKIQGFDARIDLSMMGNNYIKLSMLMSERQQIPIMFDDFLNVIRSEGSIEPNTVTIINSQGAIEQIFKQYIEFPEDFNSEGWIPSHNGFWVGSKKCQEDFDAMFLCFNKWLLPNGKIVLYPNGSKNDHVFDALMLNALKKTKELRIEEEKGRLKIIRKI